MKNDSNIANVLPELPDGTYLVRVEYDSTRTVIWRDDASSNSNFDDERWFDDNNTDALAWPEILKYATAVHAISETPLATLPAANGRPGAARRTRRPNQITVTQAIDTVAPGSSVTGLRIDNL